MNGIPKDILQIIKIIVLCTCVVSVIMSIPKLPFIGGTEEGWLGYWGSIVGVVGAYYVLRIQLKNESEQLKKQNIDNTFFNLLDMHNSILNEKADDLVSLNNFLKSKKEESDAKIEDRERQSYIGRNHERITDCLNSLIETSENGLFFNVRNLQNRLSEPEVIIYFYMKLFNDDMFEPHTDVNMEDLLEKDIKYYDSVYYNLDRLLAEVLEMENGGTLDTLENLNHVMKTHGKNFNRVSKDTRLISKICDEEQENFKYDNEKDNYINEIDQKLLEKIEIILSDKNEVSFNYSEEEKRSVVEPAYSSLQNELGNYFKMFYRIIKYINENESVIGVEQKKNYIGFLRANMSNQLLSLIYYNAKYSGYGSKLANELAKNSFLGNDSNFENLDDDFYLKDYLLWVDDDIKNIKELTNKE